jgi:hypothetical protein
VAGAAVTIRPPLVRRAIAAVLLLVIGLVVLIMAEGALAVQFGVGGVRQPWGIAVLLLVVALEVLGFWRLLTFNLVLDDGEVQLNNYFKRTRVGVTDIGAVQIIATEVTDDVLPPTRGDLIWGLVWPEQQSGAAIRLRGRAELLVATATFGRHFRPSVLAALRGWTARCGIELRENVVVLGETPESADT